MIQARVILDSISNRDARLTTFVLTYPRIILAEVNTHKMLSKNTASSRAIPSVKMIKDVKENPFIPVYWGKNQSGMQASQELDKDEQLRALDLWLRARDNAVEIAESMLSLGLHKQIANRILEPWCWVTSIVTGTDWENFFALRAHKDAQPEFRVLAEKMLEVYNESEPTYLKQGEWHTPFADKYAETLSQEDRLRVATARCARVSYVNFEGEIDHKKDFDLHDSLLKSGHMSPFEHCATPMTFTTGYSGNLNGWIQYRKTFPAPAENRRDSRVIRKVSK
jgi:thymidylate synthase ThyX